MLTKQQKRTIKRMCERGKFYGLKCNEIHRQLDAIEARARIAFKQCNYNENLFVRYCREHQGIPVSDPIKFKKIYFEKFLSEDKHLKKVVITNVSISIPRNNRGRCSI